MFNISIIIATYNRPYLLNRTLNYISDQKISSNFTVEVIVIENSKFIDENIKSICREKNYLYYHFLGLGATQARHYGISKSKGDILVIIDDDIRMSKDWLSELVKPFKDTSIHQVVESTIRI